ncbi:MAG TPA: hypothetical protein VG454_06235 [Gemmatimonadales bacterium]|nr:hypothetical protein [Gemmatimonadales bacterium]
MRLVHRLPGVPSPNTASSDQFQLSFWASLYSGVVYSLLTGIFVGLAVWWVQKSVDELRTRAMYRGELMMFRQQVSSALRKPTLINVSEDAATTEPQAATAVAKLLDERPVPMWQEILAQPAVLFSAFDRLRRAHGAFLDAANNYNLVAERYVRRVHDARRIPVANDATALKYMVGRLQGGSPDEVKPWLAGVANIATLEEDFTAFRSSPAAQPPIRDYLAARDEIMKSLDELRSALTQPPSR